MAQVIIRDLIETSDADTIGVADVDFNAASKAVSALGTAKAVAVEADVRDTPRLKQLIGDYDVVINSTWYQFNLLVMEAAIQAGVHYLDLGGLYHMTLRQLELDARAKDAGITCILGMGSSPGTMNVMAGHGGAKMTKLNKVKLRSGSAVVSKPSEVFQSPYSIRTVLDEFTMPPVVLRNGEVQEVPALSGKERFVLPDPIGEMDGYYTLHSELATLPKTLGKGVKDMDFIVAYPSEFTKTVTLLVKMGLASRSPVKMKGSEIKPYDVLATIIDSIPKSEAELDVDVQRVELYGEIDGRSTILRYDAITGPNEKWKVGGGTVDTGVPPSIASQWLANGQIKIKGAVPPESCIDPLPYFAELGKRGIEVYEYLEETRPLF
ncbi:MAG: saccharopine dehydrogenase NADP-binding domain-containing protein [Thaumarchaeota archaeon]|nr:saccharopine dehydrogenase NADP-binding domain-containing protein [Nitrososphaerota archaeon]